MKTKERIFYYDLLRALAIICVLLCHVDAYYGVLNTPIKIIAQLSIHDFGRLGVPLFLMISGALLLNKKYDIKDFLKRRFSRIIYPFIFWLILIILVNIYFHKSITRLINIAIGVNSITWYFWTLIGIYLFIPLLSTFIDEYKDEGVKYFLIIWFITMILNTFNHYPLFPDFNLDYFAGYVGFPVLGYYLANKKFSYSDSTIRILGLVMTVLSLAVYVYMDYNHLIPQIYLNVPIIFAASGIFLLIKNYSIKDCFVKRAITSISVCSYGMYFSHTIVIMFLGRINPHSMKFFPVMFALLVFFSWLLVYIFSKIPYIRKLSGV